jgi:hypothetical protein
MVLLLCEAFLALLIIVFIMWWTLKDADKPVDSELERNLPQEQTHNKNK